MKGFIYCLKCPIDNEIKYIGQTILDLKKRLKSHIYETNRNIKLGKSLTHKENWIKNLIKCNEHINIEINLIEECDVKIIDEREIFWINFYKTKKLTNIDAGGKRTFVTEETKRKISEANKGTKNGMYDKHIIPSTETIENRRVGMINSEKFQRSKKSKEYRNKVSLSQKVDDWLLLDENYKIIDIFNTSNEVAVFLGCTKGNVKNSRRDKRKLCKKFWVTYKKDYDRLL